MNNGTEIDADEAVREIKGSVARIGFKVSSKAWR